MPLNICCLFLLFMSKFNLNFKVNKKKKLKKGKFNNTIKKTNLKINL